MCVMCVLVCCVLVCCVWRACPVGETHEHLWNGMAVRGGEEASKRPGGMDRGDPMEGERRRGPSRPERRRGGLEVVRWQLRRARGGDTLDTACKSGDCCALAS